MLKAILIGAVIVVGVVVLIAVGINEAQKRGWNPFR